MLESYRGRLLGGILCGERKGDSEGPKPYGVSEGVCHGAFCLEATGVALMS